MGFSFNTLKNNKKRNYYIFKGNLYWTCHKNITSFQLWGEVSNKVEDLAKVSLNYLLFRITYKTDWWDAGSGFQDIYKSIEEVTQLFYKLALKVRNDYLTFFF